MTANINKYMEEANVFFNNVAKELGNPGDIDHASRVARAVLHSIRDRIAPEQSMHIISQLPMILKGIYVDGWKITMKTADSKTIDEFLDEVRAHSMNAAGRDFGNDQQAREVVVAVLKVIQNYVDEGEIRDLKAHLPKPLADLIQN